MFAGFVHMNKKPPYKKSQIYEKQFTYACCFVVKYLMDQTE